MSVKKGHLKKIQDLKEEVINSEYEIIECHSNGRYSPKSLIGTTYLKQKMDYGFHIYHIHEPSVTNRLAGVNGTLSEMYYDLRNREYWIKRNGKEVNFSPRNVDAIFNQHEKISVIFNLISTENNKGLYLSAYRSLGKIKDEKTEMFGRFFHRLITEYSYFELLHKSGIEFNVKYKVKNPKGSSPREILGLSKTKWKMMSHYGVDYKKIENHNEKYDTKMIAYLAYIKKLEEEYGVNKLNDFVDNEISYVYGSGGNYYSTLVLCDRYKLNVNKVLRYIYFECDVSQGLNSKSAQSNYKDYLRMVTDMEYEKFEKYPKFLRTLHDVVARNYNITLSDNERKYWDKNVELLKKYKYSNNGYKIVTPETPSDLIKEGNVLSHCVGSYIGKVVRGSCEIVFLRETKDENHPLITVEIVGKNIVQARGKMNNNPTIDQNQALLGFAKKYELNYNL